MERFFKQKKAKEIIDHYQEYEITDEQHLLLKQLYDALLDYKEHHENEENLQKILDDPKWHLIQELAGEVLKQFSFKRIGTV